MDQVGYIMLVWLLLAAMIGLRGVYLSYKLCWIVRREHPEIGLRAVGEFIKCEEKKGTCDPELIHLRREMFRTLIVSALIFLAWICAFFMIAITRTR
jgi:predicted secreted protein